MGKRRRLFPRRHWSRKRIEKIIRNLAKERGRRNEERVKEILQKMKEAKEIVDFYQTPPDTPGIDFIIINLEGRKIEIQVKSSETGLNKHKRRYPEIPGIVVNENYNDEKIQQEILNLTNN